MLDTVIHNITDKKNVIPTGTLMLKRELMPMAAEHCDMCGDCARICPSKAISITDEGWRLDLGKCLFCRKCEDACPDITEVPAPDYALNREDLIISKDTRIEDIEKPFDRSIRKMFGRSVAIRELDTGSCNLCEVELNAMSNQYYDMHRFGIKVVASPRHADILLTTGPMTLNMVKASHKTYDALAEPKMVIASGVCAISGGPFVEGDVLGDGINKVFDPVMFIPGCPPTADRVIRALVKSLGLKH